ncbi:MAG: leucine-rich repeat domain-containing protein [Chlamydiales bacterium]|nr:leucine-rich repeat domain-containing protein [Chlamydiales bacterium]
MSVAPAAKRAKVEVSAFDRLPVALLGKVFACIGQPEITATLSKACKKATYILGEVDNSTYYVLWRSYERAPALRGRITAMLEELPAEKRSYERVPFLYTLLSSEMAPVFGLSPKIALFSPAKTRVLNLSNLPRYVEAVDLHVFLLKFVTSLKEGKEFLKQIHAMNDIFERAAVIEVWLEKNKGELAAIEELDLQNSNLSHLPRQIGLFTGLKKLDLSENQLGLVPDEIGECRALEILDLSDNFLTSLTPRIALPLLRILLLTNNRLKEIPKDIGRCTQLFELCAGLNELTAIPKEIAGCEAVEELEFQDNQLETVTPAIGSLVHLRHLNLNGNKIRTLPPEIGGCVKLQGILIQRNPLEISRAQIIQLLSKKGGIFLECPE